MAKTATHKTYKELSEQLAQVMDDLQSGDLDIDKAVECYERGLTIVRELEAHLQQAENKVIRLREETQQTSGEE